MKGSIELVRRLGGNTEQFLTFDYYDDEETMMKVVESLEDLLIKNGNVVYKDVYTRKDGYVVVYLHVN